MRKPPIAAATMASFSVGLGTALLLSLLDVYVLIGALVMAVSYPLAVVLTSMALGPNRVHGWVLTLHIHVLGSVMFGVAGAAGLVMAVRWNELHPMLIIVLLAAAVGFGGFGYTAVTFSGVFNEGHRTLNVRELAEGLEAVKADVTTADPGLRLGLEICEVEFQDLHDKRRYARHLSRGERVLPGAWVLNAPDDPALPIRLYDSLRERP